MTLDQYKNAIRNGSFLGCMLVPQASQPLDKGNQLIESIKQIDDELDRFALRCSDQVREWRQRYFNSCQERREKIASFLDDVAKQGNLDIAGIKISNIHPKWHSLLFIIILIIGAIWIGGKRRHLFRILDDWMMIQHSGRKEKNAEIDADALLPAILPWWIWPAPRWIYGPEQASLRHVLTKSRGYVRARLAFMIVLSTIILMFCSSFYAQWLVSHFQISEYQQALAELTKPTFSLTGEVPTDLALLVGLFACSVTLFCWLLPPSVHLESEMAPARRRLRRRAVLAQGIGWASVVGATTFAAFFIFDPMKGRRLIGEVGRWWSNDVDPAAVSASRHREPRFRAPVRVAVSDGPIGWHRNLREGRKPEWIGHFVRPEYKITRVTSRQRGGETETSTRPAGTIGGAGGLDEKALKELQPMDIRHLPPLGSSFESVRLNTSFYSEGIEHAALERWRAGAKDDALDILQIGLTYARPISGGRLNLRLYDLLAGLLVRSEHEPDLEALIDDLRQHLERLRGWRGYIGQTEVARIESRIKSGLPDGKWRSSWRPDQGRRWNHIDI